jgi:hypothetical protein
MDVITRIRVTLDEELLVRQLTAEERAATLGGGLNLRAIALVRNDAQPDPSGWLIAHSTMRVGPLVIGLKPMVRNLIGRHLLSIVGSF